MSCVINVGNGLGSGNADLNLSRLHPTQKKTPAIPRNRRGQVFRAGCVRGGVGLPDRGQGILVGAAAGAGAAAAVTIGAVGRRAG